MIEGRFYWIKLKVDFFNSTAISYLMSQDRGSDYVIIYQMLCLMAVNTAGKMYDLVGGHVLPYDIEKIRRETKFFDTEIIVKALELFEFTGLIEKTENGIAEIKDFAAMTGSESAKSNAQRQKSYRERQKQKKDSVTKNVTEERYGKCNASVTDGVTVGDEKKNEKRVNPENELTENSFLTDKVEKRHASENCNKPLNFNIQDEKLGKKNIPESVTEGVTQSNVEYRDKSIEYRDKSIELRDIDKELDYDKEIHYEKEIDNNSLVHSDEMHTLENLPKVQNSVDGSKLPQEQEPTSKSKTSKPSKAEIEAVFEDLWKLYPVKRGKGSISYAAKQRVYGVRDQIPRCIERYVDDTKKRFGHREGGYQRWLKNGSTFFNSGYVDYLDENYEELQGTGDTGGKKGFTESTLEEFEREMRMARQ